MFETSEVPGKKKRLPVIRAQRFINAVPEQYTMIEDRNLRLFGRCDYAVNVDSRWHSSNARSHSKRCFSSFGACRGKSIGGNKPKLMFIGANCFCGVET